MDTNERLFVDGDSIRMLLEYILAAESPTAILPYHHSISNPDAGDAALILVHLTELNEGSALYGGMDAAETQAHLDRLELMVTACFRTLGVESVTVSFLGDQGIQQNLRHYGSYDPGLLWPLNADAWRMAADDEKFLSLMLSTLLDENDIVENKEEE